MHGAIENSDAAGVIAACDGAAIGIPPHSPNNAAATRAGAAMEFGIQISNTEWSQLKDRAQAAEDLGFDLVTVPDHLVAEGPEHQFDPQHILYDSLVQTAVISEATKRVRIGHLVLCNLFRHPAVTAKALASLDRLSGGRMYAGLGSGWTQREFDMTGIEFPDIKPRLRMLDEALQCIRLLWTAEEATFTGEFYKLSGAVSSPKPVQKPYPPILLGGGGRGLLRIAAKHADVVNIISDSGRPGYISLAEVAKLTNDSFRAKIKFLRDEAAKVGRDPASIRISNVIFTCMVADSADSAQAIAAGMAPLFQTTAEGLMTSPMALIGTADDCAKELLRRRREWEIDQFVFSNASPELMQQLAREVIPQVRAA
jgi:probable F420-dependent oxidoreductase